MSDIVEFLRARLDEDEATLLAEVEAKRRLVEMCEPLAQWEVRRQTRNLAQGTLRELARPYRDHPGYDPAWGV
jgi:hypothetical protein